MKKMLMFGIIFVCIIFCINYVIYNFRKQAYYRGDNIYIGDVKYESTSGLYDESDTVICYTDDGDTVYEVVGDPEHNYVSARSSWNAQLYVKEGYRVDKTAVEGYFFGLIYSDFISGKEINTISHPHQVFLDRSGNYLLVPCQARKEGKGQISIFKINHIKGILEKVYVSY